MPTEIHHAGRFDHGNCSSRCATWFYRMSVHRRFVHILSFDSAPSIKLFPVLKLVPTGETEDVGQCQQASTNGCTESDTVPVTTKGFLFCYNKYPDKTVVMDRVVSPDRVPRLSDLESGMLTYTCALIGESMRMFPATPVGIPHGMPEDEVVNG
ncbi:hypothetical protein LZ32DRAFT_689604 [Colletotrichum eremochloae]|nr:hypothetical protein LZ32DRAFT_689604 [Colletotrichum eremochloae]